MIRHYKKFKIEKKLEQVRYSPDGNRSHEIKEWGVNIGICRTSENYTECLGPMTLTDLLRLRRVIDRGIRILRRTK